MNSPWSDATAEACGIDFLRRAIAPGCGFGRRALERHRPFRPGDEPAARAAAQRAWQVGFGRNTAEERESREPDAREPDAREPDAGERDAREPDAREPDAGERDAREGGAGERDAGERDAGERDAREADAGIRERCHPEPVEGAVERRDILEPGERSVIGAARLGRIERLRAALAAAPDPSSALARAAAGAILGDDDFYDLTRLFESLAEIATLAAGLELDVPAPDAALASALAPGCARAGAFYLDDAFDPDLAAKRGESAGRQAAYDAARSRLAARAAAGVGAAGVRDGEFVLARESVPRTLPAEIRVLREAPTFLLCELALDADALAALAARDAAASEVARAEEAVRARLSGAVAAAAGPLAAACDDLGELDLLAARAAFAVRYGGVVPEIPPRPDADDAADAGDVSLFDARYPPLEELLAAHGRRYVPISLSLGGMGVVTGPNMGGKTVALQTFGFAAACVALGVPVPARAARLPLFDEIVWLGIGQASVAGGEAGLLSAFGREVVELRAFLERPRQRELVLVDEFARTTAPREGRALLIALLATLRERGCAGLAATHFAGVAARAGVAHYAIGRLKPLAALAGGLPLSLEAALERIAAGMEYVLERVDESAVAGSDALALAAALGLDPALVERAEASLREDRLP